MLTLWDLIEPILRPGKRRRADQGAPENRGRPGSIIPRAPSPVAVKPEAVAQASPNGRARLNGHVAPRAPAMASPAARESMQDRYDRITQDTLRAHTIRVRKWRTSMSGIAWYVTYQDGRISRLIEAPRPKGPMSAAVFLHEVGHHVIGFDVYKPRCLEEYHAWAWAMRTMDALGLNITDGVRHRMHESLWYAVAKARRRGLKVIPPELEPFIHRPARQRRGAPDG